MSRKRQLWRSLIAGSAVGTIALCMFASLESTSAAETAAGGASIHKEHVFWWTTPGSGTADSGSDFLAAGRTHTSTSTSQIGDSTLELTCTISNLGVDAGGNIVGSGLVTKVPGNDANKNTLHDKAGWLGESLGFLYNSGTTPNLLAHGLTFMHKYNGDPQQSGMYSRLFPEHVKAEVGKDDKPWTEQLLRFGGAVDAAGNITRHPATWPTETEFDLSCSVTIDGVTVPLEGLVVANAESNGNQAPTLEQSEHQVLTPIGEGADTATWHVLDIWDSCQPYSYRASDVYDVGMDNSLTNHPILGPKTSGNGPNDVMPECPRNNPNKSFSSSVLLKGATAMHVKMHEDSGSVGSVAVGVYLASDFGDAPLSYGVAGNYWSGTWDNALPKGSSTVLTEMAGKTHQGGVYYTGSSRVLNYHLGAYRDTENPKDIQLGNDANGDDSHNDSDEDAFVSGTDISDQMTSDGTNVSFTYDVVCTADNGTGYVGGWIDWDLDGTFNTGSEQATATCDGGKASLTWNAPVGTIEPWLARTADVSPGVHPAPFNDHSYIRLRISSKAADIKPYGIGTGEGEVEDHKITWNSPIDIAKSVDVANSGAATTLTWTVTVKNTGNVDYSTAFPMQFTDDLTDVLKVVDSITVTDAAGGTATITGNTLTWTGPVPAKGEATIVYTAAVKNYSDGDAVNTVTSAYDGKTDTAQALLPLLTVAKEATPSPVRKGETVHFTVTITNEGLGAAVGGKVVDDLTGVIDDGDVAGAPTASTGSVDLQGATMTWTGDLLPGESATVEYDVVAHGDDDEWLTNVVGVDPAWKFTDTTERQKDAETRTPIIVPRVLPSLPLTGGASADSFLIFGGMALGVALLWAFIVRLRKRSYYAMH